MTNGETAGPCNIEFNVYVNGPLPSSNTIVAVPLSPGILSGSVVTTEIIVTPHSVNITSI